MNISFLWNGTFGANSINCSKQCPAIHISCFTCFSHMVWFIITSSFRKLALLEALNISFWLCLHLTNQAMNQFYLSCQRFWMLWSLSSSSSTETVSNTEVPKLHNKDSHEKSLPECQKTKIENKLKWTIKSKTKTGMAVTSHPNVGNIWWMNNKQPGNWIAINSSG